MNIFNLRIIVGQSDLNENKQRDVSVEPGSTTNMERELLSGTLKLLLIK